MPRGRYRRLVSLRHAAATSRDNATLLTRRRDQLARFHVEADRIQRGAGTGFHPVAGFLQIILNLFRPVPRKVDFKAALSVHARRGHRLTERLFRDLLAAGEETTEAQACELEHILSPEATESVCTLLGHPPTCPHGKPIPPGACCGTLQRTIPRLVTGLPSFALGATGRIVFIAPKFHDRMDRLVALGVVPGSEIRLHQRSPSFVIEVGETTLAIDPEIAREIYVKPVEAR